VLNEIPPAGDETAPITVSVPVDNIELKNFTSLREKLQERIKLLHDERLSQKPHKIEKQQLEKMQKRQKDSKDGKREKSSNNRSVSKIAPKDQTREVMSALLQMDDGTDKSNHTLSANAVSASLHSIEFGSIHGLNTDNQAVGDEHAGQSGNKMQRLKRMLDDAERKRKRMNELKTEAINSVVRNANSGAADNDAFSFGENVAVNKLRAEQWAEAIKNAGVSSSSAGDSTTVDANRIKKVNKYL
jgi:hypothetical protein